MSEIPEEYRGQVFGGWDASATDEDIPIDTPVGNICMHCEEAIEDGDAGRITPTGLTEHRECSLRSVMGGIGHHVDHDRYCKTDPDAGLSRRQSSILVWQFLHQTGFFSGREPTDQQRGDWKARLSELVP